MNVMKWCKGLKIRQQLGALLAVAVITFLLINLLVAGQISKIVLQKNINYADNTTEKYIQELEYINEKAQSVINFLQYNNMTQDYFKREATSDAYQIFSDMDKFLTSISLIYPELEDIALIGRHRGRALIKDADLDAILRRHPNPEKLVFDSILCNISPSFEPRKMFIYVCNIYGNEIHSNYAKPIGRCVLGIRFSGKEGGVSSLLDTSEVKNDTNFLVADKNRDYYAINCSDEEAARICNLMNPERMADTIDNAEILLKSRQVGDTDLYVVSYTDKKRLLEDVRYVQWLSVLLCGVTIVILVIMTLVINGNVVSPVETLRRYMRGITDGNYMQIKNKVIVTGNREMGELADDLNTLIGEFEDRTHRLFTTTNRVYEIELSKRKAEISFLRSQINPHFLYNSLEALRGICMKNQLPEAADIASNLGKIFRYSIKGETIVEFREEIQVARAYVDIQSSRFPHKVEVLYGISEQTLHIPVIKMILQPVIENAFQHAVEKRTERTTIYIASALLGKDFVITVQDDGAGISPKRLAEIEEVLANEQMQPMQSIGLANVHLRIRMQYGEDYGVKVESSLGEGTKVTLRLSTILPEDAATMAAAVKEDCANEESDSD